MEIKLKGKKILLIAEDDEYITVTPLRLPICNSKTHAVGCNQFEITVESLKSKKK